MLMILIKKNDLIISAIYILNFFFLIFIKVYIKTVKLMIYYFFNFFKFFNDLKNYKNHENHETMKESFKNNALK